MTWVYVVLIVLIYVGIAVGRVPWLRMNRAGIALVGAAALVVLGALTEEQAIHAIDMETLLLLGAMMVINVNLRLSGFFGGVAAFTVRWARTPKLLLAGIIVASGVLSAVFLNDPVCLMFTPVVVELALRLKRDPIPYLVGLGAAANVGSVATLTGNPQNIVIGQASGIPYVTFLAYLGPVALVGLAICWGVIVLAYPSEFRGRLPDISLPAPRLYRPLMGRTLWVVGGLLVGFLAGAPIVTTACVAAGLLLISRLRPQKLLMLDWDLLAFFAGLFVVTGAIEAIGLSAQLFGAFEAVLKSGIPAFTLVTGVLSNLVSNVPAVLLLRPEIPSFADPQQAWLVLAMSSTLSGNLTLLGSAATLIVAEVAKGQGVTLGFGAYLRAGVPITVLTLGVGVVWLMLVA
jgi:Na+/H+ antiporter NhaD/arsenite permease-like protein